MTTEKNAMLQSLNRILSQTSLTLSVFEERYGGGYTAILAPILEHGAWICDQLTGEDNAAVEMQSYLGCDAGKRFPVGHGESPLDALQALDEVLAQVGDSKANIEDWWATVQAAFDSMFDAEKKYKGNPWFISTANKAGELSKVD